MKKFPNYSKSSIYIPGKGPYKTAKIDGRKLKKGRSKVFSIRDERKIIRTFFMFRETYGAFSIKRLKLISSFSENIIIRILKCKNHYIYSHEIKVWCRDMMPEHDYSLYKKWNVFFRGTLALMVSDFILMEPHGLRKLVHVTKPDQLLQWHGVKNQLVWHWNVSQKEKKRATEVNLW